MTQSHATRQLPQALQGLHSRPSARLGPQASSGDPVILDSSVPFNI